MNSSIKKSASAAAAFLLVAIAAIFSASSEATGRAAFDAATLFKAKCASCHGADGSGNTPMGKKLSVRDMRSAQVQSQSDAQLAAIISKGKGKMPPYEKSLNQQQVQEMVSFIRKLAR